MIFDNKHGRWAVSQFNMNNTPQGFANHRLEINLFLCKNKYLHILKDQNSSRCCTVSSNCTPNHLLFSKIIFAEVAELVVFLGIFIAENKNASLFNIIINNNNSKWVFFSALHVFLNNFIICQDERLPVFYVTPVSTLININLGFVDSSKHLV